MGQDLCQDEMRHVEALVPGDGDDKPQDAAVDEGVEDGQEKEGDDPGRDGDDGSPDVVIEQGQGQKGRRAFEPDVLSALTTRSRAFCSPEGQSENKKK